MEAKLTNEESRTAKRDRIAKGMQSWGMLVSILGTVVGILAVVIGLIGSDTASGVSLLSGIVIILLSQMARASFIWMAECLRTLGRIEDQQRGQD